MAQEIHLDAEPRKGAEGRGGIQVNKTCLAYGGSRNKLRASEDASAEGDLIGVLKVAADGDATSDDANPEREVLQTLVDIKCGRIALHGRAQRKNDFPDFARHNTYPRDQRLHPDVGWADAIHRRDHTTEYVVKPIKLSRVFDGHYVFGIFDDAENGAIASLVRANRAYLAVADVMTPGTKADVAAEFIERLCQGQRALFFFTDQVQHEAQCRLLAYT